MSEQFNIDQHDFLMADKKKLAEQLMKDGVIHVITPSGNRLDVNIIKTKLYNFELNVWDFNYCIKQPAYYTGSQDDDPIFKREHIGFVLTENVSDVVRQMYRFFNDLAKPAKPGIKKKLKRLKEPAFNVVYYFFHKNRNKV